MEAQTLYGQLQRNGELEMLLMCIHEADVTEEPLACPLCKADMVLKSGQHGDFFGCSKFPKCRGTRAIKIAEKPVAEAAIKDAKESIYKAMDFITDMGGVAKAKKYLRLAENMLSDE